MNTATRPSFAYVTTVLIVLNVVIQIILGFLGVSWTEPSTHDLIKFGGNLAALSLTGESWRLFTSMFIHGGIMHLAMNMYMLILIGPRAERQFGRFGMLFIYLAGGLLASCASAWWLSDAVKTNFLGQKIPMLVVSMGASGSIMAICGALLVAVAFDSVFVFEAEATHEPGFGKSLAQVVGINIVLGVLIPGIDQAAHLGGLLAGAVLGGIVYAFRQWAGPKLRLLGFVPAVLLTIACLWVILYGSDWHELQDRREMLERKL